MIRALPRPLLAALALSLALLPSPAASGDIVRLKTGETIKGRILLDKTNEQVLVIEDYLTGGMREIAWDAVSPADRESIAQVGGPHVGADKELFIKCEILTLRQEGGGSITVRGVVEGEDGGFFLVRTRQSVMRVDKARVISREDAECAPEDVYPPDDLFDKMKAEIDPKEARDWFRLARYGEQVGAYAKAKEAYETAASDETFLQRNLAQAGAARCAAILKDTEALATLSDLRNGLAFAQFKKVRDGIEGFPTKHPDASDGVKKQLETLKGQFTQKRTAFFSEQAGKQFVEILKHLIQQEVAPKEVLYNDVNTWSRKDALDNTWKELLARFQAKDPAVTAEETKAFFDGRPKKASSWKFAKYGAGSFLIEPPKIKPPTGGNKPQPQGKSGKNQGPVATIVIPKPPTRDEWWAKEKTEDRVQFWLATIVEKSGLFEVAPKREKTPCPLCNGEGIISKLNSNGTQTSYLCNRCGGAQFDLAVKYR